MARSSGYTYDPTTGNWTKSETTSSSDKPSNNSGSTPSNTKPSTNSSGGNLTSSNSDKNSSIGSVEKEYNDIEINTLTGTLNFIATKETIKLCAGDTVKLQGIGTYLSGDYYVKDITRQIGSDGYTHSATLIKTDFGDTLKIHIASENKISAMGTVATEVINQKGVSSPSTASNAQRTHQVKKGETLWSIAKRYYGDGSLNTKIYNANKDKIPNPKQICVGQVFVIP